jgi:hypothetical protein
MRDFEKHFMSKGMVIILKGMGLKCNKIHPLSYKQAYTEGGEKSKKLSKR